MKGSDVKTSFLTQKSSFCLKGLAFLFVIAGLFLSCYGTAFALNPKEEPLTIQNAQTLKELIDRSDVIAEGHLGPSIQKFRLGKHIKTFELINTIQFFSIDHKIKGDPPTKIQILITGVEPLPDKESPLNIKYPGELTEENYILFLRPIPNTPYFRLTTGMQSVYPLIYGHTIALKDASGFEQLNQLTTPQFKKIIHSMR